MVEIAKKLQLDNQFLYDLYRHCKLVRYLSDLDMYNELW